MGLLLARAWLCGLPGACDRFAGSLLSVGLHPPRGNRRQPPPLRGYEISGLTRGITAVRAPVIVRWLLAEGNQQPIEHPRLFVGLSRRRYSEEHHVAYNRMILLRNTVVATPKDADEVFGRGRKPPKRIAEENARSGGNRACGPVRECCTTTQVVLRRPRRRFCAKVIWIRV